MTGNPVENVAKQLFGPLATADDASLTLAGFMVHEQSFVRPFVVEFGKRVLDLSQRDPQTRDDRWRHLESYEPHRESRCHNRAGC